MKVGCRRLRNAELCALALLAAVFVRYAGAKQGDRGGVPRGAAPALRDADPGSGEPCTNFSFTAYSVTPSNESFAAAWSEWLLPYGSRIELHEKLFSLTNAWSPIRLYVVELGQTNLCDTLLRTNGHPDVAFKTLYADSLAIAFPGVPTAVSSATGRNISVAVADGPVPVSVARSERPAGFPPYDPEFAADPFAHVGGLSYDPTNGVVAAARLGGFTLATGDELVLIAPELTFGSQHEYPGEGLRHDDESGVYVTRGGVRGGRSESHAGDSLYPLDEPCLWEGWHVGTNTEHGCSCVPELSYGCDVSGYPDLTNTLDVVGDTAVAKVFLGETLVWSNICVHARYGSSGGRSDLLSDDGCSSCGSCATGDCDAFDGSSAGSVRFRLSLGSPADGLVSGFLWFSSDAVFQPTPSSFSLLARPDAHVSDATAGGTRTVVCSDRGGRTLAVSPIAGGVRIGVTFTATGGNDRSWEITLEGGAMRFRKFNAGGTLMSDVSHAPSGGGWAVTDNVSGRTDATVSTGKTLSWENNYSRTVETVSACGSATGSHVRVTSEVVGWGDDAVLRETARSERRSDGTWRTSHASYWDDAGSRRNGMPRMVWGDDRAWSWTDYDGLGREVFRLDQRDGSPAPEEGLYSIGALPGCDAFATVTDYTPLAGDSCHADDWDKPRVVARYVVAGGPQSPAAVLIARTWTRYVRGTAPNGWPTITETTVRACSQAAGVDDPGNAVSTVVRYDGESSAVPYLLRGEVLSETDEDGVAETHSHTVLSNAVVRTVVSRAKGGHEAKTREVRERDLDYGLTLYEATQLAADPSVEFGWRRHAYDSRRRLRHTQYDDGSSETNDYSCCRLLSRTDRAGAKTLYCTTPETERLYRAEEEVFLAQLPRGEDYHYAPAGPTAFRESFRVTQHYFDALGRETNVVVRSDRNQGASANMHSTSTRWYRTEARTVHSDGVDGFSEHVDPRGLATTVREFSSQAAEVSATEERLPGADAPDVAVTNVSYRGGGSVSVRVSSGHAVTNRSFSVYGSDGTRRDYSTTASGDCGVVTNAATAFDFLGRTVLVATPRSCVSNVYDGASSRVLRAVDLLSGVAATNLYDAVGERVGSVSRGVANESRTRYEQADGEWWRVEAQSVSSGAATNSLAEAWTQLTGLSDSRRSRTRTYVDGALRETSESSFDAGTLDLVETSVSATDGTSVRKSRFGRTLEETTPAGTVWTYYDFFGWPFYVKRGWPGMSARKHRLLGYSDVGDLTDEGEFVSTALDRVRWRGYGYDARGNRVAETNEAGHVVVRAYDADGRVTSEGGDTYPLLSGYDSAGRRTALSTTHDGSAWDETRWAYDAATGLCILKTYADGSAATNTWTADGLPLRLAVPDGRWTERAYDANRRVVGQASSDPTCAFSLSLDAFGRTVAASGDAACYGYALARNGVATNETATVGALSLDVCRAVDSCGRVVSFARDGKEDVVRYSPDTGRIASVSNAEAYVEYAYTGDLLDAGHALTLAGGAHFTRELWRNSNYQRGNVHVVTNASPVATNFLVYSYDVLNRPISRGGDAFTYNRRGEVASATVGGNAASYAYDGIGNLAASTWNAVETAYSANALNQYASIASGGATSHPGYSANGEVVSFGDILLSYDAKSRLVAVFRPAPGGGTLVVSNRYDHLDRRVQKLTPEATHTYFYDGWLLIKEVIANTNGTTDVVEYHWGKDLSGTIGGAGGIGGLLYLKRNGAIYVPWYDAYGNVMGYWDAEGNVVAEYTYDAFGKLISSSGPMADAFSIRYSTKYFDPETGFYYYGYRYYSPELMRWLTRDPIGEEGGFLLYGMCANNLIVGFDAFGLFELTLISDKTTDGDALMWFLHGNVGNTIRSDIHSQNELLEVIARESLRRGSMVTVLNVSGHGLAVGSGISFANGTELDIGKSYEKLRPFLAPNAIIKIWSCDAASTYKKCSNLRNAADALDATIYANTGSVMAGPDGNALTRTVHRIVAWVMKTGTGEWKRFTPIPKIRARGFMPGPRAFRIMKEERRLNDKTQ